MSDKYSASKILVLMYHRIAVAETDPWGLCVSPQNFEQHLQVLKNGFNVISTRELLQQVSAKKIIQDAVCITFDDGYTDNFTHAKPLLQNYNCPATFFITTGVTGRQKQFWWDELLNVLLHIKHLPAFLSIKTGTEVFEHHLVEPVLTIKMYRLHKQWKYYEEPPTDRCSLYLKLWERMLLLSCKKINTVMDTLRTWASAGISKNDQDFPMNDFQLKELSIERLFLLGIHTITHPDLSTKNRFSQLKEINGSKSDLEKNYGIKVNMLAYPFGRYNGLTIDVVSRLKITGCFTTEQKSVSAEADVKMLGRFQVFDWNGEFFEKQIIAWFS